MLIMYIVYCIALAFNSQLEQWARTLPLPCKDLTVPGELEDQHLVTYRHLDDNRQVGGNNAIPGGDKVVDFGSTGNIQTNQMDGQQPQPQPQQQQPPPPQRPPKPEYYKAKDPDPNQVST